MCMKESKRKALRDRCTPFRASKLQRTKVFTLTLLLFLGAVRCGFAAPGDVDLSFDPGSGINHSVTAVVVQPDGKSIIGGTFTTVKGLARRGIARLNADGSGDSSFDPGEQSFALLYSALAWQPDGKVLVGDYRVWSGTHHYSRVARVHSDGSLDTTFNATFTKYDDASGTFYEGPVHAIAVQPDGKVLVGGDFTAVNGTSRMRVARLNPDGSLDSSFDAGTGLHQIVAAVVVQPDGKVLIGGSLGTAVGIGIARLNSNGSLDSTFDPAIDVYDVRSMALQPDGKLLIGGGFSWGTAADEHYGIARLNSNGTLDSSFDVGTGARGVSSVVLQSDGKVCIAGEFVTVNGIARNRIARLNANGSLDSTFDPGTGPNGAVGSLALQSDGRMLIGGGFLTVEGSDRSRMARLEADGSLDTSFHPGRAAYGPASLALQPDGKVLIGGQFAFRHGTNVKHGIARLNANGTLDRSFDPATGEYGVYAIALQSDGKVLIGTPRFESDRGTDVSGIARLNSDGSLDITFHADTGAGIFYDAAFAIAVQPDGKLLVGGESVHYESDEAGNPTPVYGYFLKRLNPNGSPDTGFTPIRGTGGVVHAVALQPDGKVLVGGLALNGPNYSVARFNSNGTPDSTFNPGTGTDGVVLSIALPSDGKVLIGGDFTTVNGVNRNQIARLNPNGTVDGSFNPGLGATGGSQNGLTGVNSVAMQPDGRVLIGGHFTAVNGVNRNRIARLNADGSLDSTFDPGRGANGSVRSVALQPDGNVLVSGEFTAIDGAVRTYVARLLGDSGVPPNLPPTVSISSPTDGSRFTPPATIAINVDASDSDGSIGRVDVYADNTFIGSDNSAPFEVTWNNVGSGNYVLTAEATDNRGATATSAEVNISVTNAAPLVSIMQPANGATFAAPASITISVDATDSDGTIAQVDVYAGNTFIGSDNAAPFEVTWNNVAAGNYSLNAHATDNLGATSTSAPVNVTVTVPSPPAAPSNLTATAVSRQRINLSWTDHATDELGFKVERSTNGKPFKPIATVGANVTTYSNTGLDPGKKYSYRVRAYNAVGDSPYSNTATAKTTRRLVWGLPF